MKEYRINCNCGYSILNEAPPKMDKNATYVIVSKSIYYAHCVIIKRRDGKEYLGNNTWIVPERDLELISG